MDQTKEEIERIAERVVDAMLEQEARSERR